MSSCSILMMSTVCHAQEFSGRRGIQRAFLASLTELAMDMQEAMTHLWASRSDTRDQTLAQSKTYKICFSCVNKLSGGARPRHARALRRQMVCLLLA